MELEEQFYPTTRAELSRRLPALALLRTFRIAVGLRPMLLGGTATLLMLGGQWAIDQLPFAPENAVSERWTLAPWERWQAVHGNRASLFAEMLAQPWQTLGRAASGTDVLSPWRDVVDPGRQVFRFNNTWEQCAYAWTLLLYRLAIWSLFGGAIARFAAMRFTRQAGAGLRGSLDFAVRKFPSTFGAPLLPLVFIGLFWLICLGIGLIGKIPHAGPLMAGAVWIVPLVCGLAIACLLIIVAAGWPLMVSAVNVDGSDAFDGLSRAYDYVLNRPWYALGLGLAALLYGSLAIALISGIADLSLFVAAANAGPGFAFGSPHSMSHLELEAWMEQQTFAGFWMQFVGLLLWGFVASFFWTATTIIYALLRQSVDATPLDSVFIPIVAASDGPPLVGIAAAEQREARTAAEGGPTAVADSPATSDSEKPADAPSS